MRHVSCLTMIVLAGLCLSSLDAADPAPAARRPGRPDATILRHALEARMRAGGRIDTTIPGATGFDRALLQHSRFPTERFNRELLPAHANADRAERTRALEHRAEALRALGERLTDRDFRRQGRHADQQRTAADRPHRSEDPLPQESDRADDVGASTVGNAHRLAGVETAWQNRMNAAELMLHNRLAAIDHLRDVALDHGDMELLQHADEMEMRARQHYDARVQAANDFRDGHAELPTNNDRPAIVRPDRPAEDFGHSISSQAREDGRLFGQTKSEQGRTFGRDFGTSPTVDGSTSVNGSTSADAQDVAEQPAAETDDPAEAE